MRLKALICDVLSRHAYYWAAISEHVVDIEQFSADEYHDYPEKGHEALQARINALDVQSEKYDYILLGYGLCGKVAEGLKSGKIPIVIPRVHDCIALFLGNNTIYNQYWEGHPGTICYIDAWLERNPERLETNQLQSIGFRASYEEYAEKYGEEDAKYLFEIANSWEKKYDQCLYIANSLVRKDFSAEVKAKAGLKKWEYKKINGNPGLIRSLNFGEWTEVDFLVVETHSEISQAVDNRVIQFNKL